MKSVSAIFDLMRTGITLSGQVFFDLSKEFYVEAIVGS